MRNGRITAEVISCPGGLGDATFSAMQLHVAGFQSPYVLTLALRALGYRALSEQTDPWAVFTALAIAVNNARIAVPVDHRRCPATRGS